MKYINLTNFRRTQAATCYSFPAKTITNSLHSKTINPLKNQRTKFCNYSEILESSTTMAAKLVISLILLSLFSLSYPLPDNSISDAVEILSNSGYLSMALTLEFGSKFLTPPSPSLTIFSPSDSAFASFGQPSLALLQFHFSPLSFSSTFIKTLPYHAKIPTMSPNHTLIVTSLPSDHQVSLNGVKINQPAIYDDGSLRIFGIETFLDPDYSVSESQDGADPDLTLGQSVECLESVRGSEMNFDEAVRYLTTEGYNVMASFLQLQLVGFKDQSVVLTVFAPPDEAFRGYFGNFSEYSSIFLRHAVPCKISYQDLIDFDQGTVLPTFLEGFKINVTKSLKDLYLNNVRVNDPSLYLNDWMYIHGVEKIVPEYVPQSSQIRSSMVNLKSLTILVTFSSLFLCIFSL